jgi:predicted nucleic-acid-binding Zn-ribbon protein
MKKFIYSVFLLLITLVSFAQSVTVTQPNGGEILYACQQYTVKWNATGTSNYYNIDYSLNNGAIWTSVASNLNITNGQYVWTVPNVESSTCLLRVRDKNDTTKQDMSDAVFTIHIPVVVTSPNGGESWVGNSLHPITWNIQGTSLTFNIEYSTNGGSSWSTITSNYSTSVGTYNWTVPNIPSTNCLVRVTDAVTGCMTDISNNPFTITPAQPILLSPNGGENYNWDCNLTISWISATFYSPVRLEYSLDSGFTWQLISSGVSNNGSYTWTVPQTITSKMLIKASNSSNTNLYDISNAVFNILRPVTITSPNGGEVLRGCDASNFTFTKTTCLSGSYLAYYSIDNGATWNVLGSSSSSSSNVTIAWTVPNSVTSTQCLVRVYNTSYPAAADTGNAVFTIQPNNAITVTSPNGGEVLPALSNYVITWTNTSGASGTYNIEYSSNNGSTWSTLATNISGNTYNWTNIPNTPSNTYLIRVSDYANSCRNDVSNANFTVTPAQPLLISPNGGETYNWDCNLTITWSAATFYSSVRLDYSLDSGLTWQLISSGVSNNGSYTWTVPQTITGKMLIKASNSSNVNLNDVSNAVFSIVRPVNITLPNGGEVLRGCDINNFTFTKSSCLSGSYLAYYSTDNGATWNVLGSSSSSSSNVTIPWTVPNNVSSTQCLVRVYNTSYPAAADTGNAVFSIQPNNVVTVTSPNGGEVIPALGSTTITWSNTSGASGTYNIEYSSNNGSTWTTLATNISGNSYSWTNIPNVPTATYLVRVSDYANTCRNDVSNASFTVTPAQPVLYSPNGGEAYNWDCNVTISWSTASFYSNVKLEYSVDSGLTWQLISSNVSNSGSYNWTAPQTINNKLLIKASNTANLSLYDISNATFSIVRPVTVTSPNGGEVLRGCDANNFTFTKTTCLSGSYLAYYSIDNGATWNVLGSSSSSSGNVTIPWTVPNTVTSTQCLVRVYNTSYPAAADTSNAVFTIQPNNAITVTSPNGGEVLPALSSYLITWTNTSGASGTYNIEYSSNNGNTWSTLATNINGNTYNWTNIPNVPSTTYLVRVSDYANTCRNDVSNATFTVTPAQPVLISPNGGETYNWDCNLTITWSAATFYSTVRLDYSTDSGLTWQLISSGVTNNGSYNWTVPQTINNKLLIKASNTANLSMYDISNATFSIVRPVRIVSPNGGEVLLGCDINNFTFTKTTCLSGSYLAYYSTDNGATWNVLGSSSSSSSNVTIPWTVPNNVSSTQCLVRVYNTSYPAAADTSNAVFTIQPNNVVTVTSPNGGEVLSALSNYVITWTNTAGASGTYNIEYSSNNGSTWSTLATNISGNTYNWTNIPNVPSTTYLVRVSDYANTCRNDVSNATFTVTPAQPVLVSPNGGETYNWDCNLTIVWNAATFYSSVRLDYSLDSGLTWQQITNGTSNSGSYTWTVPQTINNKLLIKASNTSNLSLYDISNATFSILRPVRITSPNGGEVLLGCDANNFTFTKTTCLSGSYLAYYSVDSGATWNVLGSSSSSSSNVTISWTVPNSVTSTQCLVRVYNTSYPAAADTSNAVFTIQPNNAITVTSPNGGEVIPALGNYTITWTNTAGASGTYNIEYSSNNGSTWSTLATNITGNTYNWTNIPNVPSTTYLVRVSDYANTCRNDVSNATFTITPAQPILVSPNGGESLWSSSSYTIVWNAATFYSPVRLEYSLDNGLSWQVITTSTTNNGSYSWTVPNANSTTCLVKASNTSNINLNDVSNSVFTIKPAVRVFTPNGLDQLGACTQTSITFDHTPAYTAYTIEYSINNGSTWTTLVSNQTYNGTTGTYSWSVPNLSTTQARVRVYPTGYTYLADVSDTTFTIKRAVTIIQPNFGGVLQVGTSYPIIWSSDGISNLYDLAYSTNGGSTWTNIILGYNTSTNTYNWTVPNTASTNCLIRIRDNINSCKEDISDIAFTISSSAAPITITAPNGQDTLLGCQNYTIRWTESGTPLGSYNIDYTTDGGVSWLPVVANYATTAGTYQWVVPNINTTTALVRVASSANNTIFDLSNAAFNIFSRNVTAGPDTVICTGNQVQLVATGGTGTFSWSPSATLSNANIANPIATPAATTNYVVSSGNGTCIMRDTATVTVLNGSTTNVGVTIGASPSAAVCAGNQILFTATPTNGGTNPVYQWKKNGNNVGSNSANYILNPATNNDVISCVLTSNAACATNNPATSNLVTVTVFPSVSPTVTIATASTTVCAAQSVTFTATTTNGGNAPTYQWKVNGNNVGTNSASYSTATLANNDIVTCQLTSNAACVNNPTASSNALLMTVTPAIVPAVSITTPATTVCNGSSVAFTATPTNGGSTPAYQWKVNGNNTGTNSATFTTTILNNNDVVTCVLTSNAACALPASVTSNGITMSVTGSVVPSVTVSASATTICTGGSVTFTATPVNGGITPAYQWRVNSTNAGTNSNTFTTTALNNNDTVRVILTSSSGCAIPATGTSAPVVITVNPVIAPSVTVSGNNTICAGTATTFTASATNAGSSPVYQWKVNNTNTGSNSSTFTTSVLSNADSVYCIVTSSSGCATPNTATSNKITVAVSPVVVPTLSISTSTNSICSGTNTVFTATATNAGTNPVYQWKINGNNVGTNSSSYSSTTLANNDVITCVLTSSATCAQPASVTSNAITMSVNNVAAPTISISTNNSNICSGASATFTTTIANGGATPTYQWKVNGNNAGNNSATFITSTLVNNDVVTCILTSSALCASPATVTSNAIAVTVGATVTPTVTITAGGTTICAGTSVTFTANATGGGTTPVYQWKVNGNNAGTNSATFTTTTLANNDIVTCVFTSSSACATSSSVTSNAITITVNTAVTPTISIATGNNTVCAGTPVSFTATVTNAGSSPVYQWKVNGSNAGANQAGFTLASPANNDVVTCQVTSSAACATPATITSSAITLTVASAVSPTISITASSNNICSGTAVTFTATTTGGGTTPVYQWKVNGNNAGTNSATFTTTALTNNDIVTCVLTSAAACAAPASVTSNGITVTVNTSAAPNISISASNTSICAGTPVTFTATAANGGNTPVYLWKVNGNNAGSNQATFTLTGAANGDVVTCQLTSSQACATPATVSSNAVTLSVNSSVSPAISITASSTNICSGPITFTATAVNEGTTPVYQWKVNGNNAGTNSAIFTTSTLSNNDVVSCVLTSNANCATTTTATSNSITVTGSTATPIATVSASSNAVCSGAPVTFTVSVTNSGTSQAYQWKINGTNVGGNSNTYTTTTISATDSVSCVVTVTSSCSGTLVATSNKVAVQITPSVNAGVSISATSTSICQGTAVTFTATATNAGTTPTYQWLVNGQAAGSNNSQFISSTLNNNDTVTCRMSSSVACASPATAVSNNIIVQVTPSVVPSVTISPSAVTVCQGSNVSFIATATNAGANPTYQWKLNNTNTGSNSASYSNNILTTNDVVYCEVTSSAACAQPFSVSSNAVTVNITTPAIPTVSITASTTSICNGEAITFTATSVNGGNAPVYAWFVNGNNTGATTNTFVSNTLTNGDVVSCQLTSNAACVTTTTALSNTITISSGIPVTPAVTINASATAICTGTTVTFTANAVNGGTTPVYQWLVNGSPAGSNSAVFVSSALGDGDVITCVLTSNAGCTTTSTATSSPITITVTNGLQPSVTVTTSADSICAGSSVTFTASAVNAGNSPLYQWLVNNSPVSSSTNVYSTSTISGNDVVVCVVTSNAGCSNGTTVTSLPVSVTVNPILTPAVSVSTANTTVCAGQNTVFTATPVNGGNSPAYQWLVNGNTVGGNAPVFATTTLNNSDVVTVHLTSNAGCTSTPDAVSVPVAMIVNTSVDASVTIASIPADTICYGTNILFTAQPVNGGAAPIYQWKLNGNNTGNNNVTYSNNSLNDGDIIQVEMISTATCVNQATVISAGKVITVNSLPAVPVISQSGNVLTSSAPAGNQWYASSQPVSGATTQSYTANNSGWYSVAVTDANGCSSASDSVYLQFTGVTDIDWSTAVVISPNPFADQFKVTVNSDVLTSGDWVITVTDALGRVVYEKNNLLQKNIIDFTHRAAGVYVVSLKNGTQLRSYKVVKQ